MQNVHLSPPQVAKLFNVNVSTIKRWVDRGLLKASKTPGGHRRISQQQLEQFIKRYPKYSKKSYALKRLISADSFDLEEAWKEYYTHLLNKRTAESEQLIQQAIVNGVGLIDLLEKIILPSLRNIGAEWIAGNVTVYQEHRMSFIIRQQILNLDPIFRKTPVEGNVAIIACAAGEYHEIISQMIALLFHHSGWETHTLGINVSIASLKEAVRDITPGMIVVTKSYNLKRDKRYLTSLDNLVTSKKITSVFGGTGWTEIGKHAVSDSDYLTYVESLSAFNIQLQNNSTASK